MPVLGMALGTVLFLIVLIARARGSARGRSRSPWRSAAAGSNWLVFARWLRVPLPDRRAGVLSAAMDLFANLALGFSVAFTPFNLLMAVAGVILGT